jgi:hypothetical protein
LFQEAKDAASGNGAHDSRCDHIPSLRDCEEVSLATP